MKFGIKIQTFNFNVDIVLDEILKVRDGIGHNCGSAKRRVDE